MDGFMIAIKRVVWQSPPLGATRPVSMTRSINSRRKSSNFVRRMLRLVKIASNTSVLDHSLRGFFYFTIPALDVSRNARLAD